MKNRMRRKKKGVFERQRSSKVSYLTPKNEIYLVKKILTMNLRANGVHMQYLKHVKSLPFLFFFFFANCIEE